ncbi:DUF2262 domain-containing protein [Thermomonas aquatica]|uniref:DUF2262 domain-containing protein n=1 Tax=Thermomonas aquatica TaxID=2202149 RepID=A0A5B7ZPG8_9GAMM|nr:DUF2262 domain-containing protein [Thermomonas aquatica]QDA56515.1 DUF2262 domain-containing protein [Thermomonas aquatica]
MLKLLKNLFTKPIGSTASQCVPAEPIEHPILGSLVPDKKFPDSLTGRINYGGNCIELQATPDGQPIGIAIDLAIRATKDIQKLDALCKGLIADDSLDGYNSDWRFGQTALEDGSFRNFEKPLLTREEFFEKLMLENIEAYGTLMLVLTYKDNDMFWGHSFQVTFFDGPTFGDAHVSMVG